MSIKNKLKKIYQDGGAISEMGYKDNSPYKNASSLMINSPDGLITMNGVSKDLIGIDEYGNKQYMKANSGNYKFKGKKIKEYPVKQDGGIMGLNPGTGKVNKNLSTGYKELDMYADANIMGSNAGVPIQALKLSNNWDKMNNKEKGEGVGSAVGNIAGNILTMGTGGEQGTQIGKSVGGLTGGLFGESNIPQNYQYQNMNGIAIGQQGLKLNNNINKMNLREQYNNYLTTPSGKVLNDFSQGGLVKGKSHSQGGVPTYKKMQAGGQMMPQEPQQIAEVEGEGVSEDGIAVDGGERIFSVEDTEQMEAMAQEIMSAQDEQTQMELASQLGMFVVEAISRQEQVNPSEEGMAEPSMFD